MARKGYDGHIIGYQEAIVQDPNMAANNSTSVTRPFGSVKDFVRGNASQFPFAPGGLETEVVITEEDEQALDIDLDFLQDGTPRFLLAIPMQPPFTRSFLDLPAVPPGFDRGLDLGGKLLL